jgi:hypothetical protein
VVASDKKTQYRNLSMMKTNGDQTYNITLEAFDKNDNPMNDRRNLPRRGELSFSHCAENHTKRKGKKGRHGGYSERRASRGLSMAA